MLVYITYDIVCWCILPMILYASVYYLWYCMLVYITYDIVCWCILPMILYTGVYYLWYCILEYITYDIVCWCTIQEFYQNKTMIHLKQILKNTKQIPLIYQCFRDNLCYLYIGVVSKINFINKFLKNVILLNFVNYINFQILLLFLTNPTRFLIPSSS